MMSDRIERMIQTVYPDEEKLHKQYQNILKDLAEDDEGIEEMEDEDEDLA